MIIKFWKPRSGDQDNGELPERGEMRTEPSKSNKRRQRDIPTRFKAWEHNSAQKKKKAVPTTPSAVKSSFYVTASDDAESS